MMSRMKKSVESRIAQDGYGTITDPSGKKETVTAKSKKPSPASKSKKSLKASMQTNIQKTGIGLNI